MRIVGNRVATEFNSCERAHRLDVVERLLGAGIRQGVPLLQTLDAQHNGEWKRPPTALRPELGIQRLDHCFEFGPRYDRGHLGTGKDTIDLGSGIDTVVIFHADSEAGVADNVYNFSDTVGAGGDTLSLQGAASDYQFIDGANFVRVLDNATLGSTYIYGMSSATIADQVVYFA